MADHKLWKCADCLSTFGKSKLLEEHSRLTKHKAYRCTKRVACQKSFKLRTALVRHESSHAIHKKHGCRSCDKTFYRRDHCQEHEAICSALAPGAGTHVLNSDVRRRSIDEATAASLLNRLHSSQAGSSSAQRDQDSSHMGGSGISVVESPRPSTVPQPDRESGHARSMPLIIDRPLEPRLPTGNEEHEVEQDQREQDPSSYQHTEGQSSPASMPFQPRNASALSNEIHKLDWSRNACDECWARKKLCQTLGLGNPRGPPCRRCIEYNVPCTMNRPSRRRGNPRWHAEVTKRQKLEYGYRCTGSNCIFLNGYKCRTLAELEVHLRTYRCWERTQSARSTTAERDDIFDLADTPPLVQRIGQKHPPKFACGLCPARFTRNASLRDHLRTHKDDRPFVCKVCGKAFVREHDCKRHETLHAGGGAYKFVCKGTLKSGAQWGCGLGFTRSDHLTRHFRSEAACIRPLLDEQDRDNQEQQGQSFVEQTQSMEEGM